MRFDLPVVYNRCMNITSNSKKRLHALEKLVTTIEYKQLGEADFEYRDELERLKIKVKEEIKKVKVEIGDR